VVKKKVLQGLSDRQLERYIASDSRYVSEAVELAFEILQSRNRVFTEEEILAVQALIDKKKEEEKVEELQDYRTIKDEYYTDDPASIALYSDYLVYVFNLIFGFPFATGLQVWNFVKLEKYQAIIPTILYGIVFTGIQWFSMPYMIQLRDALDFRRNGIIVLLIPAIGCLGFYLLKKLYYPKGEKYRTKSFLPALIICAVLSLLYRFYLKDTIGHGIELSVFLEILNGRH